MELLSPIATMFVEAILFSVLISPLEGEMAGKPEGGYLGTVIPV